MTPFQYHELCYAWRIKQKREDYRYGVLTWVMRAIMGDKKAHPMDYFGGKPRQKVDAKARKAELEAYLRAKDSQKS